MSLTRNRHLNLLPVKEKKKAKPPNSHSLIQKPRYSVLVHLALNASSSLTSDYILEVRNAEDGGRRK